MMKEGMNLPDGVYNRFPNSSGYSEFCRISENNIAQEDRQEFLQLKQISLLKSLKTGIIFFVVLTILNIIGSLFMTLRIPMQFRYY